MNIVLVLIIRTAKQPIDFSEVNFYVKGFDLIFLWQIFRGDIF